MSEQPEAKFKKKLREAFDEVIGDLASFQTALVASMLQKAGLPDQYFAAGGRQVWVEAKVNGNPLRGAQKAVLPQMARAGVRVAVVHTAMNLDKKDRVISVAWATQLTNWEFDARHFFKWKDMASPIFWNHLLLGTGSTP